MIDLTVYSVENQQEAVNDLFHYIKEELLKTPLSELDSVASRVEVVNEVIEAFYAQFGVFPPSNILYHLSNYLLIEDIKDTSPYKSKKSYSFLSPRQLRTRYSKELLVKPELLGMLQYKRIRSTGVRKFTGNLENE